MDVGASYQPHRQISVTPMIDVVLVLLVVFMLAMQFFAFIPVNVPPPDPSTSQRPEPQVVLELRADGSYALNGTVVALSALPSRLRTLYADEGRRILQGIERAHHGDQIAGRQLVAHELEEGVPQPLGARTWRHVIVVEQNPHGARFRLDVNLCRARCRT